MRFGEILTISGFLVGGLVFFLESRRRNLDTEGMRIVAIAGLISGVVGAKIFQWLFSTGMPVSALINLQNGGKSLIGGLVCGWIGIEITKRWLRIRRSISDILALALPAGEAVGRLGCYFNGCCTGTPFDGAWSVFQDGHNRHPTQIYSAVGAACIYGILRLLRDKMPCEGDLFKIYLLLFGASRFGMEFFRQRDVTLWHMSIVQLICFQVAVFVAINIVFSYRRMRLQTS
ncbi:MAG: hypothetical protein EOO68_37165 [Moraxellaceae bacterium]|nr:MAG: hypothetical protein EOO68_37165 [Moraxellaceae bacterium]